MNWLIEELELIIRARTNIAYELSFRAPIKNISEGAFRYRLNKLGREEELQGAE